MKNSTLLFVTETIPESIMKELDSLGFSRIHAGYDYLAYAVNLLMTSGMKLPITKIIQPEVAKAFKTTSSRVERGMRYAIQYADSRSSKLREYISEEIDSRQRITNSLCLYTIAIKLHRKLGAV